MKKPPIHTGHPRTVNNALPDPPALNRDAIEKKAQEDRAKERHAE